MNKILIVGRIAVEPETKETNSGIKYSRLAVIVDRQYGENQSDFIPIISWRQQAEFIEKYLEKGSLISIEGRFTSSTYENSENKKITRYEITADRITALESKAQVEFRKKNKNKNIQSIEKDNSENIQNKKENEVPWELDL